MDIKIEEKVRTYNIKYTYHSDAKCQNYDVEIMASMEADGKITLKPGNEQAWGESFTFKHSDPDRAIAIANMIRAFAEMAKNENKKTIDMLDEAC